MWRALGVLDPAHHQPHFAAVREFHGIAAEIEQHLRQTLSITHDSAGQCRLRIDDEANVLVARLHAEQRVDLGQETAQLERAWSQLELFGLDLREVEDVVDDPQQRLAAAGENVEQLFLFGIRQLATQQVRDTQHAIHGCADLVAHHGEEARLGAVGRLGGRGVALRLGARPAHLGDDGRGEQAQAVRNRAHPDGQQHDHRQRDVEHLADRGDACSSLSSTMSSPNMPASWP